MDNGHSWGQKVRYYSSVSTIYVLTLLFAWFAIHPPAGIGRSKTPVLARLVQIESSRKNVNFISGRPVRIIIPASGVDLPVDPGYYDPVQGWTLSGYRAQFAMMSNLANNSSGDTFIYGHNNNYVFGALRHHTPAPGAQALIYADNGHVFAYSFQKAYSVGPDDVSALSYQGPPIMTIQTCTGGLNEWRTMYVFNFVKVAQ